GTSDHADIMMPAVFPVLADGLFQHVQAGTPEKYAGMVAIPNVSCDKCTLQVIEFMAPHGSNGDAGFFYHHCADLKITQDTSKPPFGTGGGGAGGAAGSAGTAGSTAGGGAGGSGGTGSSGTATGGTIGTSGTSTTTGGAGAPAGGTPTTPTGGTATAGTTTLPTSGSGGAAGANTVTVIDDGGGCGVAGRAQGGATALAALGLLLGLVRRRRAR
ncbi:MAG TPA: hypothetical protein VNG33_10020, partial [Polyangiaceae bacterium]|nr:hypothetical protein [Polyangiaceae bacterium]